MTDPNKDDYDQAMQELAEKRSEFVTEKLGEMIRNGSCSYDVKAKGRACTDWVTKELILTELLLDDDNPEHIAIACSNLFQNKIIGHDIDALISEIVERELNKIAEEVY